MKIKETVAFFEVILEEGENIKHIIREIPSSGYFKTETGFLIRLKHRPKFDRLMQKKQMSLF